MEKKQGNCTVGIEGDSSPWHLLDARGVHSGSSLAGAGQRDRHHHGHSWHWCPRQVLTMKNTLINGGLMMVLSWFDCWGWDGLIMVEDGYSELDATTTSHMCAPTRTFIHNQVSALQWASRSCGWYASEKLQKHIFYAQWFVVWDSGWST